MNDSFHKVIEKHANSNNYMVPRENGAQEGEIYIERNGQFLIKWELS
jgi:hypothetical protein